MNAEQLSKLLDSIQGHIRVFDTKAQIVLGIDSLLAGFVGAELAKACALATWDFNRTFIALFVLSAFSLAAAVASALLAIVTIVPRVHLNQPKSHFFFCHLVGFYGRDYQKASNALITLNEDQTKQELATQIQANAVIGDIKAGRSSFALYLMTASLSLYIATFLPFCIIAYRASQTSNAAPHTTIPCSVADK